MYTRDMAHTGKHFSFDNVRREPKFSVVRAKSSLTSKGPRIVNLLRRGHMLEATGIRDA